MIRKTAPDRACAWSGAALFALVDGGMKWLQAVRLQNQAFDLGIYANVVWNTGHGRLFWDSIKGVNFLGDHFSPGLALLAPLLRLWPDAAALTVAQSVALSAGIPAVHRLAWEKTGDRRAAAGFAVLYALSPLVHEVSRYDVHAAAFAVPLILWALVLDGPWSLVLLALAGTLQEDVWLCAAAAAYHKGQRRPAAGFVAMFFLSVLAVRSIGGGFVPGHWSFYDPSAVLAGLGTPNRLIGLVRLLVPLGALPLFAGPAALPLLVPLSYTFLGANPHQGLLDLQYSAPLIPFAFLAAVAGWSRLTRHPAAALAGLALLSCLWLRGYSSPLPPAKAAAAAELLALVPPDAPAAASFDLVPRLALRESVSLWRPGADPQGWVALDASPFAFVGRTQNLPAVEEFAAARRGRLVFAREGFYLLKPAAPLVE